MLIRASRLRTLVRPLQPVAARHMSILGTIQGKMHDRQAAKEAEQFTKEIQRLSKMERYNLKVFRDAVDEAESGSWFSWVNKMPGVKSQPEVQQAERFKQILHAIRPAELEDPALIKSRERQRIAAESGQTIQEVNSLLKNYENSVALHTWLRRRVADGKDLPPTQSECQIMMMSDPTGINTNAFQRKPKTGRKGRLPF